MTNRFNPAKVTYAIKGDGFILSVYTKDGTSLGSINAIGEMLDRSGRNSSDDQNTANTEDLQNTAREAAVEMAASLGLSSDCVERDERLEEFLKEDLSDDQDRRDEGLNPFAVAGRYKH